MRSVLIALSLLALLASAPSRIIRIVADGATLYVTLDQVTFDNAIVVRTDGESKRLSAGKIYLPGNVDALPFGTDGLKPNEVRLRTGIATVGEGVVTLPDGRQLTPEALGKAIEDSLASRPHSDVRAASPTPPPAIVIGPGTPVAATGVLAVGAAVLAIGSAVAPPGPSVRGYATPADAAQHCRIADVAWLAAAAQTITAPARVVQTRDGRVLPGAFVCVSDIDAAGIHVFDARKEP